MLSRREGALAAVTIPAVDDVPWTDRDKLFHRVGQHPGAVTPLMLERLLEHYDFECLGPIPSPTGARAVLWMPKDRVRLASPADFAVVVYQTELVAEELVARAMNIIIRISRERAGGM